MKNVIKALLFALGLWILYTVCAYVVNQVLDQDTITFYRVAYSLIPLGITALVGALTGIALGEDGWDLLSLRKARPSAALWAALLGLAFGLFDIGVFHFEYIAGLFAIADGKWSLAGYFGLYLAESFGLVLAAVVLTSMVTSLKVHAVGRYAPWYVAVLVGAVMATGPFLSVGPLLWLALLAVLAWLLVWVKSLIPAAAFGGAFGLVYLFFGMMGDFSPVETMPSYRPMATVLIVLVCVLLAILSVWKLAGKRVK